MRSPALLTGLYQLTGAHGYWKHGMAEREARRPGRRHYAPHAARKSELMA
ncbi:MAG: hypothetical protein ACYTG3_06670 [Planctomycetota bacterium]